MGGSPVRHHFASNTTNSTVVEWDVFTSGDWYGLTLLDLNISKKRWKEAPPGLSS